MSAFIALVYLASAQVREYPVLLAIGDKAPVEMKEDMPRLRPTPFREKYEKLLVAVPSIAGVAAYYDPESLRINALRERNATILKLAPHIKEGVVSWDDLDQALHNSLRESFEAAFGLSLDVSNSDMIVDQSISFVFEQTGVLKRAQFLPMGRPIQNKARMAKAKGEKPETLGGVFGGATYNTTISFIRGRTPESAAAFSSAAMELLKVVQTEFVRLEEEFRAAMAKLMPNVPDPLGGQFNRGQSFSE